MGVLGLSISAEYLILIGLAAALIIGFAVGLVRSRSRAIINFASFIVLFVLFRYLFYVKQNDIFSFLSGILGIDITDELGALGSEISGLFKEINNMFTEFNKEIGSTEIALLPQELCDIHFYSAILKGTFNTIAIYISLIAAIPLSYIISFLINIPFKIKHNKRNTIVTTNEKGKEVKVKVKTKFVTRLIPAGITAVLGLVIGFYNIAPAYQAEQIVNSLTATVAFIDLDVINSEISRFYSVKNQAIEKYGSLAEQYFEDYETYIVNLEGMMDAINSLQKTVKEFGSFEFLPNLGTMSFITKIKLLSFQVEYNGEKVNIIDKFDEVCWDFVESINTNLSIIGEFLSSNIDEIESQLKQN